jgi:hypothetical protein
LKIRIVIDGQDQSVSAEMTAPAVVSLLGRDSKEWVLQREDGTYVGETEPIGDIVEDGENLELVRVQRP